MTDARDFRVICLKRTTWRYQIGGDVTQLLVNYGAGDRSALDSLLPLVYDELRHIAGNYLYRERSSHTLQPTALVHEAYLRLIDQRNVDWRNRAQFYGLAAEMMRRILVNHAEQRNAAKRGSGVEHVELDETIAVDGGSDIDLLALDEALNELASFDSEKARLVEMKFFGGMTIDELSVVMGRSVASVERDWAFARGWLYNELKK